MSGCKHGRLGPPGRHGGEGVGAPAPGQCHTVMPAPARALPGDRGCRGCGRASGERASAGLDEPRLVGVDATCTRSRTPSFINTWVTCVLTVALTTNASAISLLDRPVVRSLSTSASRSVSWLSSVLADGGGGDRRTNSSMTARVTEGSTRASPAAEDEVDAFGSADVDVVSDEGFEEAKVWYQKSEKVSSCEPISVNI
jgi:hypothetical protein